MTQQDENRMRKAEEAAKTNQNQKSGPTQVPPEASLPVLQALLKAIQAIRSDLRDIQGQLRDIKAEEEYRTERIEEIFRVVDVLRSRYQEERLLLDAEDSISTYAPVAEALPSIKKTTPGAIDLKPVHEVHPRRMAGKEVMPDYIRGKNIGRQ
ncbi:hypothetical protein KDA_76970 [Dictyobacter alpinus]|uniref:Uncharacterized protein n=1 Tax=Dictyobacter alpinus TaxID=2014873 RepID=A0A402BLH7_9CHLR|nr:hypothetical protein [Dictyobacter alpinus]GCE32213.1 hypothetical protein KDA_76970 [Dictyobacter alpinus]